MASAGLFASYPPAIDPQREDWFKTAVNEWALSHGLAVRLPQAYAAADPAGLYATPAPVTLYPSLLPRSCFDEAVAIQRGYNDLYAAVASDEPWLAAVVKEYVFRRASLQPRVRAESSVHPGSTACDAAACCRILCCSICRTAVTAAGAQH